MIDKRDVQTFFDRLAPGWDAELVRNEPVIAAILDNAGVQPGVRVLDVACGTGVLFRDYTARQAGHVTAIDLSPEMAARAAEKAAGTCIEVVCGDVETDVQVQESAPYDVVMVYNAFPHFPDPAGLIRRLSGLLRPGGRLSIAHGMSRAALEAKVKELHAEDAVMFYGSVPATDIPKFTALADALIVCLSDSPDLGLTVPAKVASYMAAGKPVLASMNGAGNAAVAAAGGLSSPACDAAALADNLLALTRMDAAQRAAMGQSAKEYYLAHYRRSELLRKLEHFILEGRV